MTQKLTSSSAYLKKTSLSDGAAHSTAMPERFSIYGATPPDPSGPWQLKQPNSVHEVLAPLDRALGELHDETLLSLLLGEKVERERNGEECGEGNRRLLPSLQPAGLDLLVVDTGPKIGSDLFATPVADGRDEEHAQPGDPCDQGDDRDDVGGHASATALMQLGPCGYWTSNTGARGVWMMVPVRMIRLPPWFSTTNRSRLRGAGPPKYWPMALYLDP